LDAIVALCINGGPSIAPVYKGYDEKPGILFRPSNMEEMEFARNYIPRECYQFIRINEGRRSPEYIDLPDGTDGGHIFEFGDYQYDGNAGFISKPYAEKYPEEYIQSLLHLQEHNSASWECKLIGRAQLLELGFHRFDGEQMKEYRHGVPRFTSQKEARETVQEHYDIPVTVVFYRERHLYPYVRPSDECVFWSLTDSMNGGYLPDHSMLYLHQETATEALKTKCNRYTDDRFSVVEELEFRNGETRGYVLDDLDAERSLGRVLELADCYAGDLGFAHAYEVFREYDHLNNPVR
jgi:hypothetical protein